MQNNRTEDEYMFSSNQQRRRSIKRRIAVIWHSGVSRCVDIYLLCSNCTEIRHCYIKYVMGATLSFTFVSMLFISSCSNFSLEAINYNMTFNYRYKGKDAVSKITVQCVPWRIVPAYFEKQIARIRRPLYFSLAHTEMYSIDVIIPDICTQLFSKNIAGAVVNDEGRWAFLRNAYSGEWADVVFRQSALQEDDFTFSGISLQYESTSPVQELWHPSSGAECYKGNPDLEDLKHTDNEAYKNTMKFFEGVHSLNDPIDAIRGPWPYNPSLRQVLAGHGVPPYPPLSWVGMSRGAFPEQARQEINNKIERGVVRYYRHSCDALSDGFSFLTK